MHNLPPNIHEPQNATIPAPPGLMMQGFYQTAPIIREPLGYDLTHPARPLAWVIILAVCAYLLGLMNPAARIGVSWFYAFLAVSFIVNCVIFARRASGQRSGEEIHSLEAGYSIITRLLPSLPVPVCEQLLTPAALGLVGYIMTRPLIYWGDYRGVAYYQPFSVVLGWWLILCACSYLLVARWEYRLRLAEVRAVINQMKQAQVFSGRLNAHEAAARSSAMPQGKQTASAYDDEPDAATLAADPDMDGFARGGDGASPDRMTWFRRRRA